MCWNKINNRGVVTMAIYFGQVQIMVWEGELHIASDTEHEEIKIPINIGDTFKLQNNLTGKNIDHLEFPYFQEDIPQNVDEPCPVCKTLIGNIRQGKIIKP